MCAPPTAGLGRARCQTFDRFAVAALVAGVLASPASAQFQFAPGGTPGFGAIPNAAQPAPAPAATPPAGRAPRSEPEPKSPHTSLPAIPRGKVALALAARFTAEGSVVSTALHWRVFGDKPDANGNHLLVAESRDAAPIFALDPGNYIVHAAYGLAGIARRVVLTAEPVRETFAIKAGGMRLQGTVGDQTLPAAKVSFDIYAGSLIGGGPERLLMRGVEPGAMVLLPEGVYQVVSSYGDANAVVRSDVRVQPGRITEATLKHRAAGVTLKLVHESGGNALANTAWSVLTPAGDVIKESIGAFPAMVLQEGEYVVIARNEGRSFSRDVRVEPGADREIEVTTKDVATNAPTPNRRGRPVPQ